MAKNYIHSGEYIHAAADDPATPASGGAVVVGTIAGVAVTKEAEGGNSAGECTIATQGVFTLPVVGHDGSTDAAVSLGDKLYYDSTNHRICKDTNGVIYGKALATVAEGDTKSIDVMLIQA